MCVALLPNQEVVFNKYVMTSTVITPINNTSRKRKVQIFLPPEVESILKVQAAAEGQSLSGYIRALCSAKANATNFWSLTQSKHNAIKEFAQNA
jgi:hypothetical protein